MIHETLCVHADIAGIIAQKTTHESRSGQEVEALELHCLDLPLRQFERMRDVGQRLPACFACASEQLADRRRTTGFDDESGLILLLITHSKFP